MLLKRGDLWLGLKEVGRRDRGNEPRKRPATSLACGETTKQKVYQFLREGGVTMKMGLLCISRGEGEEEGWPLVGCGHSQPGLVTDLEPWRPKQPPGGRAVGETSYPHHALVSRAQIALRGAKASPYNPKPRARAPCRDGPSRAGAATLTNAQVPVQKRDRW